MLLLADDRIQHDMVTFFRNYGLDVVIAETAFHGENFVAKSNLEDAHLIISLNYNCYPPRHLFNKGEFRWVNLHLGKLPEY